MSTAYQLAPPPKWDPPDVSPLTFIFIFYHFLNKSFESLNATHYYNFQTQKMPFLLLCPPIKNFHVFALDPTTPCLDWQLSSFLTSQPTYDPFKFDLKLIPKCKIWLKCQFPLKSSTTKKFVLYHHMMMAMVCEKYITQIIYFKRRMCQSVKNHFPSVYKFLCCPQGSQKIYLHYYLRNHTPYSSHIAVTTCSDARGIQKKCNANYVR